MLVHRTGSRYDGKDWPPYQGTIDLPQWEADDLIRDGLAEDPAAVQLDRGYAVLKEASPDYEDKLKPVDYDEEEEDPRYVRKAHPAPVQEADDYDSDFDREDSDEDFDREPAVTEPQVKRPYANAKKDEWIRYVVDRGFIEYGDAKNLTKAALMEMDS